ncbi:hypothetical protein [Lysinibacillus fusiformis]|uniref:hypothetical protein n=1 Tax=Lysinibacillus fusiformis TaxID=28031 RepID=UPI00088E3107|nr:hypothetical protein [Lysinibacillus fusiformis]SCX51969.1 Phage-related protein [Lysinibacillus fusiformis]SDB27838.1 Phage-related protein [Lysinibacillus fusiformis]SFI22334.1 Phage-related protein [Lysinibacillus fusiformis]SFS82500.1 Phage-related protein [Lysinibacillus fusiformis]
MNGNFTARIGARITEFMARMRQVQNTIRTTANDVNVDVGADVSEFNRRMAEIRARIATLVRERVVIKIEARIENFQRKIQRIATDIRAFGELMQHTLTGSLIAVLPMIAPLIANIGVAIANLGPMIGTLAGSTFALVGAFASAGVAAGAFAAVAIPTIKKLFDENAKLSSAQMSAKSSFDNMKKTYQSLVKETEKPVLKAFTSAMQITNTLLTKLRPLFLSSAQAVSSLMTQLNAAIGTPPIQKFLDYLNTTGAPMLKTVTRSMGNLFKGLASMLVAFAPLTASTAKGFEEMTARFADWSNGLSSSSKFQSFMDYVNENMPKIRAIFRDATAGIIYFFSAFAGSSSGMMDGLVAMMVRFKEWSASLSQNQGFQTFLSYVQQTAPSVLQLIGNLTNFLVNLGIGMAPVGAGLMNIVNSILEFMNSGMESNRMIGVLIASFISIGGVLLAVVPNIIAFGELFKGLGPAITGGIGKALKGVGGLFTNFSGTLTTVGAKILSFVKTFGKGLITNPVGLIVIAIVAFIAVLVRLYQTNEKFRSQVQAVWEVIKTGISMAVTAIKNSIMSVWAQITSFWNENQESIKATASTIWKFIGDVVTTAMTVIGAIMKFVWPVVKALIVSTWDAIMNVIKGAVNIILGIVKVFTSLFQGDWKGVWDGVKQILVGALQAVWGVVNLYFVGKLLGPLKAFGSTAKTFLQGIWTAIKGIFTNTLNTIKSTVTTIFNGMKSTITSIWNSLKSFFNTILNGIKSIFTSVWRSIASFLDNMFTSITGLVRSVWNGIKNFISTVLNAIANVIKSIWTGIKNTVSTILNGIKNVIETIWNGFKTTVSTAMENVKTAVVNGWNAAKSFLENISLVKIGEYIVAGLVTGINNWFGKVKAKVMELAELLPEWLRNKLGIHSPSRVMIALAKWIPIGVAKGIESVTNVVQKATNTMAGKAIPDFSKSITTTKSAMDNINYIVKNSTSNTSANALAIQKDYAKKRADLDRKTEQQISVIKASSSKKTHTNTKAQQLRINNILADAAASRQKLAKQEADALAKARSKSQAETLEALEQYVSNKESLELWSTEQQAGYWKYATTLFKENTKERIKAQNNYNKAMAELAKEQFEKEKNYIERKKNFNQLSLTQELVAYEKYMKQYKAGSEERIYYEEKVAQTKKEIHEKLLSLNEEYTSKIQEANQKLIDGSKALTQEYEDAVKSRTQSLYSVAGIFDEMEEKAAVSGQKLIDNLRGQNQVFQEWAANLQALGAKGIDQGLLSELQALGPSASAEIAALNTLSATQLAEYVALWQEKSNLARTQAELELTGMKADTAKKIEELTAETSTQLDTYKTEWANKIKEVRTGTVNQFNAMVATMPQIGRNVIKGMQQGLAELTPDLLAQAQSIAESIKATIQGALDIHSPSRWGKKMIGHNLVKGIIIGLADMKSDAIKAAERVAEWIQPHVEVSDIINDINGAIDAIQTEIEHKVKVDVNVNGEGGQGTNGKGVHQEVHLHSPTALSPSENARQLKRVAQQLAF